MKRFNITTRDVCLFDKFHFPIHSIFGKYNLPLLVAEYNTTGYSELVYYIDDFTRYKHSISTNRGKVSFYYYHVHIYNAQQDRFIHITKQYKEMKEFYKFITETMTKAQEKGNLKPVEPNLDWQHGGVPKERKTPVYSDVTENPYKPVYCAAFSQFRTPIDNAEEFADSRCHDISVPISANKYQSMEMDRGQGVNRIYLQKTPKTSVINKPSEKHITIHCSNRDKTEYEEQARLLEATEILRKKMK